MTTKILTLFPELDDWTKKIFSRSFVDACAKHVIGLGYSSKFIGDQICIIGPEGDSSCQQGTLVGWRFVNDIEKFVADNDMPWFESMGRTPEELAKGFAIISQLASMVSNLIIQDE